MPQDLIHDPERGDAPQAGEPPVPPPLPVAALAAGDDGSSLAAYAQRAYLEYALSVVKGRALPDVVDGQKPVQRRILYTMAQMGLGYSGNAPAKPVKSARVVGDVLGKYHPHGDSAAYDALVRMAQDFSQRYPLIDGQGNFGSRDGDGAAAMRYTEARLAKITRLLLQEIDQGTVQFVPADDDIHSVLDYRKVRQIIIDECTAEHVNLLETLIGKVSHRLMQLPGVIGVRVRIAKLAIFDDCEVAIRMETGQW